MLTSPKKLLSAVIISTTLLSPVVSMATAASDADWQPVASEKLIRMPAKYMDVSIERHYQKSSLATGINALDTQIQMEVARMNESHSAVEEADVEQAVALRHQFLIAKSNYLELMHEKHQLSERALTKKAKLYQKVDLLT